MDIIIQSDIASLNNFFILAASLLGVSGVATFLLDRLSPTSRFFEPAVFVSLGSLLITLISAYLLLAYHTSL